MTTISRREVGFNDRDLSIAIALGAGMTGEETAEFAGVDRSTVYSRKATNKDFIEAWAARVKNALEQKLALQSEKIKAKYETMYETAINNLADDLSMDVPDSFARALRQKATFRMLDQAEGKPVQRVKLDSTSSHTEEVKLLPSDELKTLISSIQQTARVLVPAPLPALPPADYEDATLVE